MAQFTKQDIVQFIQDTIASNDGSISPTMIKDIQQLIKNQVEIGNVDDYVKKMGEDSYEIKRLFEDVLDGKVDTNVTVNTNIESNIDGSTFKDMVTEQSSFNKGFMALGLSLGGFKTIFGEIREVMAPKINTVLGEEKENLIDPVVDITNRLRSLSPFGSKDGSSSDMVDDSRDYLAGNDFPTPASGECCDDSAGIAGRSESILRDLYSAQLENTAITKDGDTGIIDVNTKSAAFISQLKEGISGGNMILDSIEHINSMISTSNEGIYEIIKEYFKQQQRVWADEEEFRNKPGFLEQLLRDFLIAGLAGLAVGAWVGAMIIPFQVIGKIASSLFYTITGLERSTRTIGMVITSFSEKMKVFGKAVMKGFFWPVVQLGKGLVKLGDMFVDFTNTGTKTAKVFKLFFDVFKKTHGVKYIKAFMDGIKSMGGIGGALLKLRQAFKAFIELGEILWSSESLVIKLARFFTRFSDMISALGGASGPLARIPVIGEKLQSAAQGFGNFVDRFKSFIDRIGNLMNMGTRASGTLAKVVKGVGWVVNQFGAFAKALKWAFKFLAWPLQVIFLAVDFIKGFYGSDEKSFVGKFTDGIKQMIYGFFEFPLIALGWVYDKILGLMGIESKGTGKKLAKWFKTFLKMVPLRAFLTSVFGYIADQFDLIWGGIKSVFRIITNTFGAIWNLMTLDFSGFAGNIEGIWDDVLSIVTKAIKFIFNWITMPIRILKDLVVDQWQNIKGLLSGTMFEPLIFMFESIANFVIGVADWVKEKLAGIPVVGRLLMSDKERITHLNDEVKEDYNKEMVKRDNALAEIARIVALGDKRDHLLWSNASLIEDQREKVVEYEAEMAKHQAEIAKNLEKIGESTTDEVKKAIPKVAEMPKEMVEKVTTEIASKTLPVMENFNMDLDVEKAMEGMSLGNIKQKSQAGMIAVQQTTSPYINSAMGGISESMDVAKSMIQPLLNKLQPSVNRIGDSAEKLFEMLDKKLEPAIDKIRIRVNEMSTSTGLGMSSFVGATTAHRETAKKVVEKTAKQVMEVGKKSLDTVKTNIEPLATQAPKIPAEMITKVDKAKALMAERQMAINRAIMESFKKLNKDIVDKPQQPIVVNTPEADRNTFEPPEDIEAMSVLFLNKSWGLK